MTPNRRASRNTSNKHRGRARAVARRSVCVRAEIRCGRDETVSVERDMNHDLIAFTLAVHALPDPTGLSSPPQATRSSPEA